MATQAKAAFTTFKGLPMGVKVFWCGVTVAIPTVIIGNKFRTSKLISCPSSPVPEGRTRICVAGFHLSPPTGKAHFLADAIAKKHPNQYETWYYFDLYTFYKFTAWRFANVEFPERLKGHDTSPFVWLERGEMLTAEPLGGCDDFSDWVIANPALRDDDEIQTMALKQPSPFRHLKHTGRGKPKPTAYGCLSSRCGHK